MFNTYRVLVSVTKKTMRLGSFRHLGCEIGDRTNGEVMRRDNARISTPKLYSAWT